MNIKHICTAIGAALLSFSTVRAQELLSLTLAECRERALAHSEELQQADNRLEQARLDRQIASTAALPNIEGSATGAYVLPNIDMMSMELRMRGTYMAGAHPHAADLCRRQNLGRTPHGPHRRGGGRRTAAHDPHGCIGRGGQRLLDTGGRRRQGAHARKLRGTDGHALHPDGGGRRGGHGSRKRPATHRGQAQRDPLPASEGPQRRRPVPHVVVSGDRRRQRRAARAGGHPLPTGGAGRAAGRSGGTARTADAQAAGGPRRAADPRRPFGNAAHGRSLAGIYLLRQHQTQQHGRCG